MWRASYAKDCWHVRRENERLRDALSEADDLLAIIESEEHGARANEITVLRGKINSLANDKHTDEG